MKAAVIYEMSIFFNPSHVTQPLTEMITGNISCGQRRSVRRVDNLPTLCADCLQMWESEPPGNFSACPGPYTD